MTATSDYKVKDKHGDFPIDIAINQGFWEAFALLYKKQG